MPVISMLALVIQAIYRSHHYSYMAGFVISRLESKLLSKFSVESDEPWYMWKAVTADM